LGERWWRRKRRFDPWFGDSFEETDKTERILDDMIHQAFGSPEEREKARSYYVYQFGNLNSTHSGGSQIDKYDPLVDVLSEETNVIVVAELPGVDKDQIEVHASEDKIEISVGSSRWKYYNKLNLPAKVDPKSSATSYKNGVLEIRLKKLVGKSFLIK